MRIALIAAAVVPVSVLLATPPAAAQMPKKVGACTASVITHIGSRFEEKLVKPQGDDIDQGTSVRLRNGVYGVSYEYVPAVAASRIGDKVMTCLASVPKRCPKGDDRGRMYTTTNLRTQQSWTLPDAPHLCGGA